MLSVFCAQRKSNIVIRVVKLQAVFVTTLFFYLAMINWYSKTQL